MKNSIGVILVFVFGICGVNAQNLVTYIPTEKSKNISVDTIITVLDATKELKHFVVAENKITLQEGNLLANKKTGKWFSYYPNGVLLSMGEYENGLRNGMYLECEKSGAVVVQEFYKDDKLNGEQKKYATTKNVRILKSIYNYTDGIFNGTCTEFTDMGYTQSQIQYANGKKDGFSKWYFSNGILAMEQTYINDVLSGTQKVYNQQGKVISEGAYSANLKNGKWTEYFDSGKMKSQGSYTNDIKSGTWQYYDESGAIIKTETL